MVLRRLGNYVTDVLVNGTQEASYEITDSASFDVGISTSGTPSQSIGTTFSGSIGAGDDVRPLAHGQSVQYDTLQITMTTQEYGDAKLVVDGDVKFNHSSSSSNTYTNTWTSGGGSYNDIHMSNGAGGDVSNSTSWEISYSINNDVSTTYTVDGVTKS